MLKNCESRRLCGGRVRSLVEPFCCVLSVGTERGHGGTKEERRGRACDRTFSCRRTERRASKAAGTEGRLYKKAESSVSGSAGRSEERRVGKEGVSECRSRGCPFH